jgi:hypothetical protein
MVPHQFRFEVIPLSEAPSPLGRVKVGGLEAVPLETPQVFAGSVAALNAGAVGYEVRGVLPGNKTWIVEEAGKCQLMREIHCDESEWLGEFPTVDEALKALARKAR